MRLVKVNVNVKEAITYINELVFAKQGRWLEDPEKVVLESAWLDRDYEQVVRDEGYNINLLQRRVAPRLWVLLTGILGNGEKVTKKRLRRIVERRMQTAKSPEAGFDLNNAQKSLSILEGILPEIANFYGRTPEMMMLKELLAQERCVVLTGVPGIGKSYLAAKLVEVMVAGSLEFSKIIWKPISYAPVLTELLDELLKIIDDSGEEKLDLPESSQAKISMLFSKMQKCRYLIVLDSAESILKGDRNTSLNQYGKEYAEYGNFFKRIVEEQHSSCFLIISREPFVDIKRLQQKGQAARTIKLEGLGKEALNIFRANGLKDDERWGDLIHTYRGNPLSLNMVAKKIKNFFGGSVNKFLVFNTILMTDVFEENLDEIFANTGRLTTLEKKLILCLADELTKCNGKSITFSQLIIMMKEKYDQEIYTSKIIDAIEALFERSLIEQELSANEEILLSLQPLVVKYINNYYSKIS